MMEFHEESGILYEVVVSADWPNHLQAQENSSAQDTTELPKSNVWFAVFLRPLLWLLSWISWFLSEFVGRYAVPDIFVHLWNAEIPWKIAAVRPEQNGQPDNPAYAAVLKFAHLEVRRSSDEFTKAVEEFRTKSDPFPSLRKLTWSRDGRFLALAQSDGKITIFDRTSAKSATSHISKPWTLSGKLIRTRILSEILWISAFTSEDTYGLVLAFLNGSIRLYGVSHDGSIVERSKLKFQSQFPKLSKCICAAAYSKRSDLIVTASSINQSVNEDLDDSWKGGLTLWRIVSESPFLIPALDASTPGAQRSRALYSKFGRARDGAVKMALNPSEDALITLFASGSIAVWAFPCLRLRRLWMMEDMPKYTASPASTVKLKLDADSFPLKDVATYPVNVQWWSDSAIVLCQANGAVSLLDVTGRELHNITHGSFELFRPGCAISCSLSDNFLLLEEEVTGKAWEQNSSFAGEDISPNNSELSDESEHMRSILSETLQSLGLEDPSVPNTKTKKTVPAYRLNCFQTASPVEMFNRKLGNEEYGEALVIAQRFGLDADLVHQKRWLKSPVTREAISDYLVKISNAFWILRECLDRVPSDPDVVRDLLNVGLRLTSLSSILTLHPECCPEVETPVVVTLKKSRSQKSPVIYDVNCSPERVDIAKLHPEQISLIGHRRQLLRYLDMLAVYEEVIGGGEKALRYFLAGEYKEIRRGSFLELALHYAQNCQPEELHTLRFLRSEELLPFWLDILSNFPETYPPEKYQFLIPSTLGGEILQTQSGPRRPLDWSEQQPFASVKDQGTLEYQENLSRLHENLAFKGDITPQKLGDWFRSRILEIESRTGLVENSQQMIQIAAAKGTEDWTTLGDDFQTLDSLVYGAQIHDMTFDRLKSLSDEQILRLFDKCRLDTFPLVLRSSVLPFLKRCERRNPGSHLRLLRDYMIEISSSPNTLDKCLKIFQQSVPNMPDPVIPSAADCVQLAVDCIYANSRMDQLEQMKAILDCLPSRTDTGGKGDALDPVYEQASEMEELIRCVEFFALFGIQLSVRNLREIRENDAVIVDFLMHFLKLTTQKSPGYSETEWKNIFSQYQRTCSRLFSVGKDTVIELFAGALLKSGKVAYIRLGTKFLSLPVREDVSPKSQETESWTVTQHLSQSKSVALLLVVGREYFNNSDNWKDPRLQHARRCFELVQEVSEEAKREMKLISALDLLHMCGVNAEPLDLRTNPDRFRYIQDVLNVNSTIYKFVERLMELADALDIKDKIRITQAVAEKAFERKEYSFCRDLCSKLMEDKRESAWELCVKLATVDEFSDNDFKDLLFNFAVATCPDDQLQNITEMKKQSEMAKLKSRLASFEPSNLSRDWIDPVARLPSDPCWLTAGVDTKATSVNNMYENLKRMSDSVDYLAEASLFLKQHDHTDDCILNLVMQAVKFDFGLVLELLGLLKKKTSAEEFFDLVPETVAATQFAAYYYALEMQLTRTNLDVPSILKKSVNDVISAVHNIETDTEHLAELNGNFRKYLSKLQPAPVRKSATQKGPKNTRASAYHQPTQNLLLGAADANGCAKLKGVDETKFRSDPEYRKKSILRAAATKDSDAVKNALEVAKQNDIATWEVVASFVKFLYTSSALSADDINGLVRANTDLISQLRGNRVEFIQFSGQFIQPLMANSDISILESYYDFLENIKRLR